MRCRTIAAGWARPSFRGHLRIPLIVIAEIAAS